ncbi:MAG: DUF2066 domain-containing protein [Cellvibrionaceae bacterium]
MALAIRILMLCLLCVHAYAQERVDLYQAELLVVDQSQRERNQAMVDGLAESIVRASGQPRVLENPQVIEAVNRAANYLTEWRYESTEETITIDGREVPAQRLVLRYSGNAIERLLRDLRLPIWPANRPTMLVWTVVDSGNGRSRVSSSSAPEILDLIKAAAKRRGVPLITPLMDLEDQVAVPTEQLWSLRQEIIGQASERYDADSILVGRLTETSRGDWRGGWLLMHRGQSVSFDVSGADAVDVVAGGIGQVADYFLQLYGIVPNEGPSEALAFQVDGVEGFADYTRVMNYLQGLAVVGRTDLVAVQGGSLLLYLYLEGNTASLRDALSLDRRLTPHSSLSDIVVSDTVVPPGSPGNPLRYRWR